MAKVHSTTMNEQQRWLSDGVHKKMMTTKRMRFKKSMAQLLLVQQSSDIGTDNEESSDVSTDIDYDSTHYRRQCGGCLKVTTQRDSLAMSYYNDPTAIQNSSTTTPTTPTGTFTIGETGSVPVVSAVVQWGTIQIHSHAIVLGDNPCTVGPPISLSWEKVIDTITLSIDDYEMSLSRRTLKQQLIIPKSIRMEWFKELGYSRGEIQQSMDQGRTIRKYRNQHAKQTIWEKLRHL